MDPKIKALVSRLIACFLPSKNDKIKERAILFAEEIFCSSIIHNNIKSSRYWYNKWSKAGIRRVDYIYQTNKIFFGLINPQLLCVFDQLKGTSRQSSQKLIQHSNEDGIILLELLNLLQGGSSSMISFESGKISIYINIVPSQSFVVESIISIVQCLHDIQRTMVTLKGTVGQALVNVIGIMLRDFFGFITKMKESCRTLFSLFSRLSSPNTDNLLALSFICRNLCDNDEQNLLTALNIISNHGSDMIRSICKKLIRAGEMAYYEIIKLWITRGNLDDYYGEFFIYQNNGEYYHNLSWNNQFCIENSNIPSFLFDFDTISMIFDSGKAWNMIKSIKEVILHQYSFHNSKLMDIIISSQIYTESRWKGNIVCLADIRLIYNESMSVLMMIFKKILCIQNHFKTLHHFLLFSRGDFSLSLFNTYITENKYDLFHLLNISIRTISVNNDYTNSLTDENLLQNLEIQARNTKYLSKSPNSINLFYILPETIQFLIEKDTMITYQSVSQLLWEIKCHEFKLLAGWKTSRSMNYHYSNSRSQSAYRHQILLTIRSLLNTLFLIIQTHYSSLITNISSSNDFHTLHQSIQKHASALQNAILDSDRISHIQSFLTTIEKFCQSEDEIFSIIEIADQSNIKRISIDLQDAFFPLHQTYQEFLQKANLIQTCF